MSTTATATTTSSSTVDVITTVDGDNEYGQAAAKGGALIGFESKNTSPKNLPVEFIDWPFSKEGSGVSVAEHLRLVAEHQPKYAVAPDIQDGRSLGRTLDVASDLAAHVETVIVPPKDVRPARIPDRYRVGMPAQDRYGGLPWSVDEFKKADPVHILGGGPATQRDLGKVWGLDVASLDTASILVGVRNYQIWYDGGWADADGTDLYDRIEATFYNLHAEWNSDGPGLAKHEGMAPEDLPEAPDTSGVDITHTTPACGYPNPDLLDPEDEMPFPGRGHFYQDDALDVAGKKVAALTDTERARLTANA